MTQEQIKALLRKPFCLGLIMEEHDFDWQAIFTDLGCNFQQYGLTTIPGGWSQGYVSIQRDYTNHGTTFKLRSDYKPASGIVEVQIEPDNGSILRHCKYNGNVPTLAEAMCSPDFIGFKFEDGMVHATPIWYSHNESPNFSKLKNDDVKVLHAKSVLFRSTK